MGELEIIKTKLLDSHKRIAKGLNLAYGKSVIIDGIYFFISDCTFQARIFYGDSELEVYEFTGGKSKIAIGGEISVAIKDLYKPMMQWKKIRKHLTEENNI